MRRLIVYSLFLVLLLEVVLGVGFHFAKGVSLKNLSLYFAVALIAVDAALRPGRFVFSELDIHVPFLLFILYALLSWTIAGALDPAYATFRGLVTLKGQIVDHYLYFLVFRYGVTRYDDFLWLLRAITGTLLVTSLLTLVDFLDIPDLGIVGTHDGRVEGPVGEANQYGVLLAFTVPLSVALLPKHGGWLRILWLAGVLSSVLLLLATGSRGAYLAITLSAVATLVYLHGQLDLARVARMAGVAILMLAIATVVLAVTSGELLRLVADKTTVGDVGTVSSGRTEIWMAGLRVMAEKPWSYIVGSGWNAWASSGIWKGSHNVYVEVFFELGVIGLAVFLVILHNVLARARAGLAGAGEPAPAVLAAFIVGFGAVCIAIFFVAIAGTWMVVWSLTGLVLGLSTEHPDP